MRNRGGRTGLEQRISSIKHSRLLDRHQFLEQERVGLHGRMSVLTAWGLLKAGDYTNMRQMEIRLPRPSLAAEPGEAQECAECCLCPRHSRLTAQDKLERLIARSIRIARIFSTPENPTFQKEER